MLDSRLILATMLLTAPALYAQDLAGQQHEITKPDTQVAPITETKPEKANENEFEPYRITITFKTTDGGKITTQRTYTVEATSRETNPEIRDDSRIPVKTGSSNQFQYMDAKTDVDIRGLRKRESLVYMALFISTTSFAETDSVKIGADYSQPIIHSHQYTISPTIPIGKQTTVYSAIDSVNNTNVEVQVLVQPIAAK